jgi:Na+/H+-translocating membrane pyrophosphatase
LKNNFREKYYHQVATEGNVRTAIACYKGTMNDGLQTAFKAGAVMGFYVVGLGLTGLSAMYWFQDIGEERPNSMIMEILAGEETIIYGILTGAA